MKVEEVLGKGKEDTTSSNAPRNMPTHQKNPQNYQKQRTDVSPYREMNPPSPKQWVTTKNYKPNNVYVKGESSNTGYARNQHFDFDNQGMTPNSDKNGSKNLKGCL